MGQFTRIFKKVNGVEILKQYARSHVLLHAILSLLIGGTSRKSLEILRLSVENKNLKKLRKKYAKFIQSYKQTHKEPEGKNPPIIWVCWFQGMANAPEIVKICYQSLQKIPGYEVRLITADNYSEYVAFPDYIIEKYKKGSIGQAHFSDLLRLELLTRYGGTWIDSTVLCTSPDIPREILESDLFVYRILKPGVDGHSTTISNWLITACQNNRILDLTLALLYEYWRKNDSAIDYFIFHLFFELAMEAYPQEAGKIPPYSNEPPHILLLRLFDEFDPKVYYAVIHQTAFHKLSYKFSAEDLLKENTYYQHIVERKA